MKSCLSLSHRGKKATWQIVYCLWFTNGNGLALGHRNLEMQKKKNAEARNGNFSILRSPPTTRSVPQFQNRPVSGQTGCCYLQVKQPDPVVVSSPVVFLLLLRV
ncbi:hypothetical protein CDAR_72371 [Caerostris darwini]|uniref:Uncharacterized protein n=1 Tax=Caerostris darwini TaxID=1538125 RepID=A0AAV4MKJ6_9ARAC|nr:hypothetical protein CDAR_72371 [Caerostris darwini]